MNNVQNKQTRALLGLITVNVYWGLTTVLMKNVLYYMSANAYIFLRFTSAALFLIVIYFRKIRNVKVRTWYKGIILGLLISFPMMLSVYGLNFTSTSNSVFIGQLTFVVVPAFVMIRYRQKPTKTFVITCALLLVGLLIFSDVAHGGLNVGDLITFVGMLLNSVTILVTASFAKDENTIELGIAQIIGAAFFSILFGWRDMHQVVWNYDSIVIIILTGVIGSGVAFTMRTHSQKFLSPETISMISIVSPIFGVIGAAIIPDVNKQVELVTLQKIIGSIILIVALVYYSRKELISLRVKHD